MRWLPNFITSIRLLASPFLSWLLLERRFRYALAAVLLTGMTDALDGLAARWLGMTGGAGMVFDPMADKVMLLTLFVTLGYMKSIPRWMLYLAIGRDLVIVGGSLLLVRFRNVRSFRPTKLGKVSTFFQIVLVFTVLLSLAFESRILVWLWETALILTALFTAASGVGYVLIGIRMTRAGRVIDGNRA